MLEGFSGLGYHVALVAGYANDRRRAIQKIRQWSRDGLRFDFLYSESASVPTLLTERHHAPTHPFLDFGLFRWARVRAVPVGLFYRDVYWRFDLWKRLVPWHKRIIALPLYWYDWLEYLKLVDHLFLPSLAMKRFLPGEWPDSRLSEAPPGCTPEKASSARICQSGLQVLYVGGVTPPLYDLRPMLDALRRVGHGVVLTLCCRLREWRDVRTYYSLNDNVRVLHVSGRDLDTLYANADIFSLVRKPHPYLDFAMPVKVFEALGHGVPIVTAQGTEVARFVAKEGVGWVVSGEKDFHNLLLRLRSNRNLVANKRKKVLTILERHSWVARARSIATALARYHQR